VQCARLATVLWTSAIGCRLMAGVYFAFSAFIMTSLGRIAPASPSEMRGAAPSLRDAITDALGSTGKERTLSSYS